MQFAEEHLFIPWYFTFRLTFTYFSDANSSFILLWRLILWISMYIQYTNVHQCQNWRTLASTQPAPVSGSAGAGVGTPRRTIRCIYIHIYYLDISWGREDSDWHSVQHLYLLHYIEWLTIWDLVSTKAIYFWLWNSFTKPMVSILFHWTKTVRIG